MAHSLQDDQHTQVACWYSCYTVNPAVVAWRTVCRTISTHKLLAITAATQSTQQLGTCVQVFVHAREHL
jgi:hypothetical protein